MEESANDFWEPLADSDKAGQEAAPITGPTPVMPFEGFFQAGFLKLEAAILLLLESEPPSADKEISGDGDEEEEKQGACEGEHSEEIVRSGTEATGREIDDGCEEGEWWEAEVALDSP